MDIPRTVFITEDQLLAGTPQPGERLPMRARETMLGQSKGVDMPLEMSRDVLFSRIAVSEVDGLKPLKTLGGEKINYLPGHFDQVDVSLKETARIVATTGPNGEKLAYLIKPNARTIVDVTRVCGAHCPACINSMYEASMPEDYFAPGKRVARGDRSAETLTRIRVFNQLGDQYFADAQEAMRFSVERAGITAITLTGGEPTNIGSKLIRLVEVMGPRTFPEVKDIKLFTHGGPLLERFPKWDKKGEKYEGTMLDELIDRGVTHLTISRHHDLDQTNKDYMGDVVPDERQLKEIIRVAKGKGVFVRFSCLVQKGYIESADDLKRYAEWAKGVGADAVIFRALAMTEALNEDEIAKRTGVDDWVSQHRVAFPVVQQMLDGVADFTPGKLIEQKVKTRQGYVYDGMPITLEGKHDPSSLETDIGVLTLFPGVEGADLTYRWVRPDQHRVYFKGEDWTVTSEGKRLPYFRDPEPKKMLESTLHQTQQQT